ncbi:hypothetical protein EJD97_014600 [Solanum chilense]|uniref:Uncharacterized protein n=1 Tax=Solanum chilense TaxID=4083 RepID=A0A6N2BBI4_SOLCI|nr:hypothetical protein EJD97_014600 [Solanum chilense]
MKAVASSEIDEATSSHPNEQAPATTPTQAANGEKSSRRGRTTFPVCEGKENSGQIQVLQPLKDGSFQIRLGSFSCSVHYFKLLML